MLEVELELVLSDNLTYLLYLVFKSNSSFKFYRVELLLRSHLCIIEIILSPCMCTSELTLFPYARKSAEFASVWCPPLSAYTCP